MNTPTQALKGAAPPAAQTVAHTRWIQLGLGLVCMMTISSPQYVWTLMTKPLMAKLGKHDRGKGCVYIKRLADVDLKVLEQVIAKAVAYAKDK